MGEVGQSEEVVNALSGAGMESSMQDDSQEAQHAVIGSQPNSTLPSPTASSTNTDTHAGPICANCSTQTTSLWRRSAEGQTLCNACSLYQKMKGTPRPVSLKTDTIKHRNRSKGDKKLKEGQPLRGKAKKAAASNASRSSSVGPAGMANPGAGRLHELNEADEDGDTSIDDTRSDNGSTYSAYTTYNHRHPAAGGLMGTSQRPRNSFEMLHMPNGGYSSAHQAPYTEAQAHAARNQEMAAAMALAGANQHQPQHQPPQQSGASAANGVHTATQPPRARPAPSQPYQPYPNNIAAHVNQAFAARQARDMAAFNFTSQRSQPHSVTSSLGNSPISASASTSHITSAQPATSSQPQVTQLPLPQPTQTQSYRDWSPKPLSGNLDPGRHSATPTDTPQRSPLSTSIQHTSNEGARSSGNSPVNAMAIPNRTGPSPTATTSSQPSQAPATHQNPYANLRPGYSAADADRERQKARLEQLFAEAGQRLSEGNSTHPPAHQQDSPVHATSASSSGKASTVQRNSASYKPYDRSLSRSSSRPGRAGGDRWDAATATSSVRQTVQPRNMRPGSSASSSGDSAEQKKGIAGLTSPAHTLNSPRLAGIPDSEHEGMAVDEQMDLHTMHTDPSPPFGVSASSLGLEPSAASERRGRSTTRKLREGEYNDSVAYEMGALRMRDVSRASSYSHSRSQSPAQLPKLSSHLAGYVNSYPSQPGSRDSSGGGATIKTGDLDDGIVRNAVTHRPVSDLRASHSPASGQTLPSLSEALSSSSASSRSASGPRSMSRHSAVRKPMSLIAGAGPEETNGHALPAMVSGGDEVARLNIRIRELEFINGLMEGRLHDLESKLAATTVPPSHGPDCRCRCAGEVSQEGRNGADQLKNELAAHGKGGMSEQQCRDLFELLVVKKGYRAGDLL